jgi:hypothetical protein
MNRMLVELRSLLEDFGKIEIFISGWKTNYYSNVEMKFPS